MTDNHIGLRMVTFTLYLTEEMILETIRYGDSNMVSKI